jgi:hypothetical protein
MDAYPEGILLVSGGMVRRKRQFRKVIDLELNLRPPGDFKPERAKNIQNFFPHAVYRVPMSTGNRQTAWQSEVLRRCIEFCLPKSIPKSSESRIESRFDFRPRRINFLSHLTLAFGWYSAHRAQDPS